MPPNATTEYAHGGSTNEKQKQFASRGSSFFDQLHQQSHNKSIPQLKVSLQDLSYSPVTASASSKTLREKTKKPKRTQVLNSVSTTIHPFRLNGWMGPSGSGKTSLISVVAGLVEDPQQDITGSIAVSNNEQQVAMNTVPKQQVGVVWQDDLLLSNLTVQETIYFAARLKTPSKVSNETVQVLVEETMKELGLWHVRNSLIGSSTTGPPGISGGERKRTAVAVELVVRPPLLLCDEPTSGLDATTAHSLIKTLKGLASLGHSIVVVIHQPRTDIFQLLDNLLLLSKGSVVYDGPTAEVRSYLEGLSSSTVSPLPPETGIADWIMDTIIRDEQYRANAIRNGEVDSEKYTSLSQCWAKRRLALENEHAKSVNSTASTETSSTPLPLVAKSAPIMPNNKYEASFWTEFKMLTHRITKQQRGNKLTIASLLLMLTYLTFTNFLYWRLPDDTSNIYERNSLMFFLLIAQGMGIVTTSIAIFHRERGLFKRERAKKLYRVLPFFLAKLISDSTNNIFFPLVYGLITYWTAGLRQAAVPFLKFVLGYYLSLCCAQSMGFFLSVFIPDMGLAMILAPPFTLFMFISAGFYIPFHNLNAFMKWLSYVSFARYGYSSLLINEYQGRDIPCPSVDLDFSGITIGGSGDECPLPGSAVYEGLGLTGTFANYWFNIGILAIFQIVFLVGAYVLLRRSK